MNDHYKSCGMTIYKANTAMRRPAKPAKELPTLTFEAAAFDVAAVALVVAEPVALLVEVPTTVATVAEPLAPVVVTVAVVVTTTAVVAGAEVEAPAAAVLLWERVFE